MGSNALAGMLELTDTETALAWHLQSNHYPPIPASMIPVCREAIRLATDGDWRAEVTLPNGVSYRGRSTAPVSAIIEAHHLEQFSRIHR